MWMHSSHLESPGECKRKLNFTKGESKSEFKSEFNEENLYLWYGKQYMYVCTFHMKRDEKVSSKKILYHTLKKFLIPGGRSRAEKLAIRMHVVKQLLRNT